MNLHAPGSYVVAMPGNVTQRSRRILDYAVIGVNNVPPACGNQVNAYVSRGYGAGAMVRRRSNNDGWLLNTHRTNIPMTDDFTDHFPIAVKITI